MIELLQLILHIVASLFKSRAKLEAEILVLRQQLNVLRRQVSKRPQLNNADRLLLVWLYRWFSSILGAIAILRPETIIRWHRGGFGHTGGEGYLGRTEPDLDEPDRRHGGEISLVHGDIVGLEESGRLASARQPPWRQHVGPASRNARLLASLSVAVVPE
jgi:hypothetical protein